MVISNVDFRGVELESNCCRTESMERNERTGMEGSGKSGFRDYTYPVKSTKSAFRFQNNCREFAEAMAVG